MLKTFQLSWEEIENRKSLSGKALRFCAFLSPDQIPEELVLLGLRLAETEKGRDALEMDEALGLLYRYSLVERTEGVLSLHRLIQEVIQEMLREDEQQEWIERSVLVVHAVFPSGEYGTWPLCEWLLPHALLCARWVLHLEQKEHEAACLLGVTARYLYERAQYAPAEPLYLRALTISEEALGATHPQTAASLNNLALLYRSLLAISSISRPSR